MIEKKISKTITEYEWENFGIIENVCKTDKSIEHFLGEIDKLENKVCRITVATWKSFFKKNQDGLWESSNIDDLFMGTGIKKATVQTFTPETTQLGFTFWNYSFEASYLGTPKDGSPLPEGYIDRYTWRSQEVKLPCEYIKMSLF